ncbi:hypothetical protein OAV62_02035 [bacterium]|nr:hypothetical protein [bacterium]
MQKKALDYGVNPEWLHNMSECQNRTNQPSKALEAIELALAFDVNNVHYQELRERFSRNMR